MKDLDAAINISFKGPNVRELMQENHLMVRAIFHKASSLMDGYVKVHVTPREPLGDMAWSMVIATPGGNTTLLALQKNLSASVSFATQ